MESTYAIDDLVRIMLEVDEEAVLSYGRSKHFEVIIVGSSALLLYDLTTRTTTYDIDIIEFDQELQPIFQKHPQISTQVSIYQDRLPKNFRSRLIKVPLETLIVDYFIPCPEDLTVMKLYSWRKQDKKDLLSRTMLEALNRDLLDKLIYEENEAQAVSLTKTMYLQMVKTYEKDFIPKAKRSGKAFRAIAPIAVKAARARR